MLDDRDWKASTDRALANTESILRSIGSRLRAHLTQSFRARLAAHRAPNSGRRGRGRQRTPLTAFHDSTHNSSILDASTANASLSMAPPKQVVSEIDRMYVQIKAEMDARCTALQRSTDTLRDEVRGEFQ